MVFYLINIFVILVFIALFILFKIIDKKWLKIDDYIARLTTTVNSIRYGNLSTKIDKIDYKKYSGLSVSINRMVETLNDREKMIVEYQNELMRKNESLKEIDKLRKDFIETLTHDLKVPIVAEANMLDFLLNGKFGEVNSKQLEALNNMKASNKELLELVQTLLETYKIDESGIELVKTKFELSAFISSIVEDMQPIAEKSGLKINFSTNEKIYIWADELQLKRVVKNLIQNAISHSQSREDIRIELNQDENHVKISIIDYGQGIEQEEINKIFEKYYSTAKKFRKIGTGLGLYLSQQIIKAHGGEITVNSEKNVSTEFCVNFLKNLDI